MPLNATEATYWRRYLDGLRLPEGTAVPEVTAGYAGGPELSDGLLALYLEGGKTAGSSLAEDFAASDEPLPRVGDYWILLRSDGEPGCLLRTDRIETHRFADVPARIAVAEGEGDLSLAHWRRVHAELYAPHLEAWGVSDLDDATVVTEFFTVVQR